MRNPTFVPAEQEDRIIRKSERDIREILRESDDRARKIFERHDRDNPPHGTLPKNAPEKEEK